jgi:hypothetical protein
VGGIALTCAIAFLALAAPTGLFAQGASTAPAGKGGVHYKENSVSSEAMEPSARDTVALPGLPRFGKWMYAPDFTEAHWLGATYQKRHIREPINVVIRDPFSVTPEQAIARLMASCREAGFPRSRTATFPSIKRGIDSRSAWNASPAMRFKRTLTWGISS